VPTPPAPEVKLEVPDFKVPDIKLDIPDFKAPDIKLDVPEFKAPDIKIPEFSAPKFDMPKAPSLSVPETSFEMPKVSIPSFDMPKVSAPSFSIPGYESTEAEEDIEPQEVRDERARAARAVYKEADATAKVSFIHFTTPWRNRAKTNIFASINDRKLKRKLKSYEQSQTVRKRLRRRQKTTRVRLVWEANFFVSGLLIRDIKLWSRLMYGLVNLGGSGIPPTTRLLRGCRQTPFQKRCRRRQKYKFDAACEPFLFQYLQSMCLASYLNANMLLSILRFSHYEI